LGTEATSCRDGATKRAWYVAEQRLRNKTDRTYEARMDFSLRELEASSGGIATAPDTDVRSLLLQAARTP